MSVDIEQIMEEIHCDVENDKRECDIPAAFDVVSLAELGDVNERQELYNEVTYLYGKHSIAAYRELKSHRRIIGKIIIFFKKVIRKLTKFYIEPIVEDQNEWNLHCAHAICSARLLLEEKDHEIDTLRAELSRQQEKQRELEMSVSRLIRNSK